MDCFTNQITDSIWGSNEWVDIYQIVIDRTWAIVENQLNGTIRTFFAGNCELNFHERCFRYMWWRKILLFRLLKCLLLWSSYLLCVGFPTISTLSTLITIKKLSQCHSFNMFTWDFIGWQCQMLCWILLFTIGWMLGMWYFKYLLVFLIG